NHVVALRWLPAAGLGESGPPLLGAVAERSGRGMWHVLEDLGECTLGVGPADAARARAAMKLVARLHTRFVGHRLLAECRLWGGDRSAYFYASNARDALNALSALQPPHIELSPPRAALRERLFNRLYRLLDEHPLRAQQLAEHGGAETFLHGDL